MLSIEMHAQGVSDSAYAVASESVIDFRHNLLGRYWQALVSGHVSHWFGISVVCLGMLAQQCVTVPSQSHCLCKPYCQLSWETGTSGTASPSLHGLVKAGRSWRMDGKPIGYCETPPRAQFLCFMDAGWNLAVSLFLCSK